MPTTTHGDAGYIDLSLYFRTTDLLYLRTGWCPGRPYAADMAAITTAASRGASEELVQRFWQLPEHARGAVEAKKNFGGTEDYIRKKYAIAKAKIDKGEHVDVDVERAQLFEFRRQAASRPWPGKGGFNECRTYVTLIERAIKRTYPNAVVAASLNGIAQDIALRDSATVHRSLGRLSEQGLIRAVDIGDGTRATRWRILPATATPAPDFDDSRMVQSIGHDVFCNAGLGAGAWLTWCHLGQEPATVAQVRARTGHSAATTRNRLERLEQAGLAARAGRWWSIGETTLDDAAERLGVTGVAASIRKALQRDLDNWHGQPHEDTES